MKISKRSVLAVVLLVVIAVAGGGYYVSRHGRATESAAEHAGQYTCPMHPFILKDKPGSCPICGMTLVKKVEGSTAGAKDREMLIHVSLSPTQQLMANVATVKVDKMPMDKEINATGIVQYDQSRQAKVTTGSGADRSWIQPIHGAWRSSTAESSTQ